MTTFERLRFNYLRASFVQAKQEGKLPQWFLKQGLFWLIRTAFMIFVVTPTRLIWRYTERGCEDNDLVHIIKFCGGIVLYFLILGTIVCAPFMGNSAATVTH